MPGFTTHYLFGVNACHHLGSSPLKKMICENHGAFSLGMQGPDIFFYYLPSHIIHRENIGAIAHMENTGIFLERLLASVSLFPDPKEAAIAQAYVMGFIGHYLLDCRCHPYVYWRTRYQERTPRYNGRHMEFEVEIDAELLDLYKHKLPSAFRQCSTIALARRERRVIAMVLYYVYTMAYPDLHVTYGDVCLAIRCVQAGTRLLHDPRGRKKQLMRKVERTILGHPLISSLIPSDTLQFFRDPLNLLHRKWRNPWKHSACSDASFLQLLEDAQEEYIELLPEIYRLFVAEKNADAKTARFRDILRRLGNLSYHSGL